MYKDQAFIALPQMNNLTKRGLTYTDMYTYIGIRSFNNNDEDLCYPSYETIAKRMRVSRAFVIESIKRLEEAGLIIVVRSDQLKVCNHYYFPGFKQYEYFDRIPYSIFDIEDLSLHEKAMLICLRQFFQGEERKWSCFTIKEFAKHLDLSYKTVYQQYHNLVSKFYIEEVKDRRQRKKKYNLQLRQLTPQFNWWFNNNIKEREPIGGGELLLYIDDNNLLKVKCAQDNETQNNDESIVLKFT